MFLRRAVISRSHSANPDEFSLHQISRPFPLVSNDCNGIRSGDGTNIGTALFSLVTSSIRPCERKAPVSSR
jgi:hypothetical protein